MKKLPKYAEYLLNLFLPESDLINLNGDYKEIFSQIYEEKGRRSANIWIFKQIIKSFPLYLFDWFKWRTIMFKNYFKIALRTVKRQKGYSFINLTGLSVGLASFILISLFIRYEFSYEKHNVKADRIYRINQIMPYDNSPVSDHSQAPLAPYLLDNVPEVEEAVRFFVAPLVPSVAYKNKKFQEREIFFTDRSVFKVFSFSFVNGTEETALNEKYTCVISEDFAEKYFGDEDPVGKILIVAEDVNIKVAGVFKNLPQNSDFRYNILISFSTLSELFGDRLSGNRSSQILTTWVLVRKNTSYLEVQAKINLVFKEFYPGEPRPGNILERLDKIHLYSKATPYGNIKYIYIFGSAAILLLLIACFNFMNLATARYANRAKEVGLRKVVGANRRMLISQFIGESLLFSFISLLIALIITVLFLPVLMEITGQELQPNMLLTGSSILGIVFLTAVVGLISGSYPAFFLSAFQPVKVIKGELSSGSMNANFRKTLTVLQFVISVCLIICMLLVQKQITFLQNRDLGFRKDNIVVVRLKGPVANDPELLKNELLNHSAILGASASYLLPSRIGMYNDVTWEGANDGEVIGLWQNKVDFDFINTYELELVKGRNFKREFTSDYMDYSSENSGAVILNETAVKRFGWDDPIGKKVIQVQDGGKWYFTVVGVVKDFHFSSLRNEIEPVNFFLRPTRLNYLSIKITGDNIPGTLKFLEDKWNIVNPDSPFDYFFLGESFASMYRVEESMKEIITIFSILTIFIACLGLFGLASFSAERRTKEIGIRKVMGASFANIIFFLSRDFIKWVLIANIISWPAAYFVMNNWLSNFAYHINIGFESFVISCLASVVIAVLTVSYRAVKTATINPVDSLRNE
ncbi:ABC transporter permease [candidate division KSB1 bacterium]